MSSSEIINKQHTSQSLSEDLQSSPWINLLIHDPDSSVGLTSNCGLTSLSSWWSSSPCLQARSAQPNFSCHEQHPVREQRNDQYHVDHKYAQVFRNKEKTSSWRTHPCNRCNTSHLWFHVSVTWWCSWQTDLKWSRGDWSGVTAEWPHQNQSSHQNMALSLPRCKIGACYAPWSASGHAMISL